MEHGLNSAASKTDLVVLMIRMRFTEPFRVNIAKVIIETSRGVKFQHQWIQSQQKDESQEPGLLYLALRS